MGGAGRRAMARTLARGGPRLDPGRAAELLAPIAAARMAVIYRKFLDDIEPSEQAYHRADVPDWLHRTAALLGPAEQRPAPAEA